MKRAFYYFFYLLQSSLLSPFTWLSMSLLWFLISWIFALMMEQTSQASISTSIWWGAFFSIFLIPPMCANAYFKNGKSQFFILLRSYQIPALNLVLAQIASKLLLILLFDLIFLIELFWLARHSNIDFGFSMFQILGLLLLQVSYLSLTNLVSACLENQASTILLSLFLFLISWMFFYSPQLLSKDPYSLAKILVEISLYKHFFRFFEGYFSTIDFVYPLLFSIFCIHLGSVAVKR